LSFPMPAPVSRCAQFLSFPYFPSLYLFTLQRTNTSTAQRKRRPGDMRHKEPTSPCGLMALPFWEIHESQHWPTLATSRQYGQSATSFRLCHMCVADYTSVSSRHRRKSARTGRDRSASRQQRGRNKSGTGDQRAADVKMIRDKGDERLLQSNITGRVGRRDGWIGL
jgi:hypothetical protein